MDRCDGNEFPECRWRQWLWATVAFVQIIFGTVGNILNIIILCRQRMRKYSTTVYLLCLAVTDVVTLFTAALPGMLQIVFRLYLWGMSEVFCKTIDWISHSAAGYSVWLLVLMTVERVLLTRSPVIARSRLNRCTASVVSLIFLIFSVSLPAHYMFGYTIKEITIKRDNVSLSIAKCEPASEEFAVFYKTTWPLIILLILNIIPVVIILTANFIMVVTLILQRQKLLKVYPKGEIEKKTFNKRSKSSTKMIFILSGFFVFTTLPYTINRTINVQTSSPKEEARKALLDTVLLLLLYCNFAANFLLYFVSGTMFKQELKAFLNAAKAKCTQSISRLQHHSFETRQINVTVLATTNHTAVFR